LLLFFLRNNCSPDIRQSFGSPAHLHAGELGHGCLRGGDEPCHGDGREDLEIAQDPADEGTGAGVEDQEPDEDRDRKRRDNLAPARFGQERRQKELVGGKVTDQGFDGPGDWALSGAAAVDLGVPVAVGGTGRPAAAAVSAAARRVRVTDGPIQAGPTGMGDSSTASHHRSSP
jgi:hypothetical protein